MISGFCDEAGDPADVGDQQPCLSALDGFFPIPCQAPTAAKPSKCALHDPSARQHLEPLGGIGSLDDLQRPAPEADKGVTQFRSLAAQPGKDPGRAIAILNASAVDRANEPPLVCRRPST